MMMTSISQRVKTALLTCAVIATASFQIGCGGPAAKKAAPMDEKGQMLRRYEPDWSENATLPPRGDRANIYEIEDEAEWRKLVRTGTNHLLEYPVGPTGMLMPIRLVEEIMGWWVVRRVTGLADINEFYDWMGLNAYPETDADIPFPGGVRPDYPMGVSMRTTSAGDAAMTFGCATCHSGTLFGRPVLGMTNRFPRANEAFARVHDMVKLVNINVVKAVTKASDGELAMLKENKETFKWIGVKKPEALGLDTSLAQVGLSLARRELDPYARRTEESAKNPRPNPLEKFVADSKPAVWWNIKYKTRFLSDGSLVAGNPIFTNFLWNEIGRGADLEKLETWIEDSEGIVKEITAAAFATEAPLYTEFFPAESINLEKAKHGEALFVGHCARCHGHYDKAWSQEGSEGLTLAQQLKTVRVRYHEKTPVKNVGTDAQRAEGMKYFADRLNELAISKTIGTTVTPQDGYVPPPLVGIWARWPYFHNNSVPSLCAVLQKASERPKSYYSGEPVDPERDFDQECNGYPLGDKTPKAWKTKEHLYDTSKPGLRNIGHDEGIFLQGGEEIFTAEDKRAIVEFLKTL